jgi:hypothetical protein
VVRHAPAEAAVAAPRAEEAAEVRQWGAQAAAAAQQQEAAVRVGAAVRQPEEAAAPAVAEVPQQAGAARVAAAGVVRRPEARGEPGVARSSAAPWAFHPDQVLPWPARPPAARLAREMEGLRIASP